MDEQLKQRALLAIAEMQRPMSALRGSPSERLRRYRVIARRFASEMEACGFLLCAALEPSRCFVIVIPTTNPVDRDVVERMTAAFRANVAYVRSMEAAARSIAKPSPAVTVSAPQPSCARPREPGRRQRHIARATSSNDPGGEDPEPEPEPPDAATHEVAA